MLCTCMCTAYVLSTTQHVYKLFGVYNSAVTLCAVHMKGYTNCCAIVHVYVANIGQLMSCQSNNVQKSTHATFLLCFHSCLLVLPCLHAVLAHALKNISVDLRNPLIINKLFCCKDRRPISSTTKCNLTTHYRQNLWQPTNKAKTMLQKYGSGALMGLVP